MAEGLAANANPCSCALEPSEVTTRVQEWKSLAPARVSYESRPGTVRVRYARSEELRVALERLVQEERVCCSFASFAVRADGDALLLEIAGPPGTDGTFGFLAR